MDKQPKDFTLEDLFDATTLREEYIDYLVRVEITDSSPNDHILVQRGFVDGRFEISAFKGDGQPILPFPSKEFIQRGSG